MDFVLLIIGIMLIVLMVMIFMKLNAPKTDNENDIKAITEAVRHENASSDKLLREEVSSSVQSNVKALGEILASTQKSSGDAVNEQLKMLENRFKSLEASNEMKLEAIRSNMTKHLIGIQEENNKKLDAIQSTVNEKLENKMNESFKLVSERLEQVYKGLGEMQNIASGVGDLKKVLSNVKNRGILGEIQLGAILGDILAPEQYDCDIATIPNSSNRVEYAVKLPGGSDERCIYLPIDSKFPRRHLCGFAGCL